MTNEPMTPRQKMEARIKLTLAAKAEAKAKAAKERTSNPGLAAHLKRRREALSTHINTTKHSSPDSGASHVLITPDGYVLSKETGTWSRVLREATSGGTDIAKAYPEAALVASGDARKMLIAALETEKADVEAKLRDLCA